MKKTINIYNTIVYMVLFSQKSVAFTLATFCIIAIASYFSGFIQKKMRE